MKLKFAAAMLAGGMVLGASAQAATITFEGITSGPIIADTFSEAGFEIDIVDGFGGAEGAGLEYERLLGTSGTATITRSGGGTFDFVSVDLQLEYGATTSATFEGYLAGALVGSDTFATSDFNYATFGASNLAGVLIDELLILAERGDFDGVAVDNLVVDGATDVPAPAALGLLVLGLAGLASRQKA